MARPRFFIVRLGLAVVVLLAAVQLASYTERLATEASSPFPLEAAPRFNQRAALIPAFAPDLLAGDLRPAFPARVARGQTLSGLYRDLGLGEDDVAAATSATLQHLSANRLRAGSRYAVAYDSGAPFQVAFDVAGKGRLHVKKLAPSRWEPEWEPYRRFTRLRRVSGTLDGSLMASLRAAGAESMLASHLERVLQWDLDFHRDLRQGDRFEVLFEEVLLEGRADSIGEIHAVFYENRGRVLEAYLYGQSGHYDGDGRPLRKRFLRSPMRYSRITSGFSTRRFHPVNKRYQPHWGVDYGAPTGTPVYATASGVVESAGRNGGGGNVVKVRHANGYLTAYLHLSRFASGVRKGRRVDQGQTVGYVGSTGLATAPHLDYRVQRHGRWINPAALASEPSPPIPDSELQEFLARRDLLRDQLRSSDPLPSVPVSDPLAEGTIAGAY